MARKIRCKRSYHTYKVGDVQPFAGGVRDGIYGNPATFMTPPVTPIIFQGIIDNYSLKRDAFVAGGAAQKGDYIIAKDALMELLDNTATYVDGIANGNAAIVMEGGYVPTKGTASAVVAPLKPEGVTLVRTNNNLELVSDCIVVAGAESYGAILTANEPLPPNVNINGFGQIVVNDDDQNPSTPSSPSVATGPIKYVLDFNKSRIKKFTGLTKGTVYYLYYFSANAAGVSPLSIAVSLDAW